MKTDNQTRFFSMASNQTFRQGRVSLASSLLRIAIIFFAITYGAIAGARTIFVNYQATGSNNGSSWGNAYTTIGAALDAATSAADIWVTEGTYPMPRCQYPIGNNVNIYGGFAGTETQISGRRFTGNLPTIQTLLLEPNSGTNCYLFAPAGTTNIFNGLTFSAIGGIIQSGGVVTVTSATFTRAPYDQATAVGGNGVVSHNNATLKVDKSLFQNLLASIGGGVAGLNAASITVTNSTFSGNIALGASFYDYDVGAVRYLSGGGAITVDGNFSYPFYNFGSAVNTQVTINGNTFTDNQAGQPTGGGAIYVANADIVRITNSTFGSLDSNGVPIPADSNNAINDTWWASIPNANGGAIVVTASNQATLSGNKFYGNLANAGSGGAIYTSAENQNALISITSSSFVGNGASIGGAIADADQITGSTKTVAMVIKTNIFTNNTATLFGPAIAYDGTEAAINGKTTSASINRSLLNNNPTLRNADIYP